MAKPNHKNIKNKKPPRGSIRATGPNRKKGIPYVPYDFRASVMSKKDIMNPTHPIVRPPEHSWIHHIGDWSSNEVYRLTNEAYRLVNEAYRLVNKINHLGKTINQCILCNISDDYRNMVREMVGSTSWEILRSSVVILCVDSIVKTLHANPVRWVYLAIGALVYMTANFIHDIVYKECHGKKAVWRLTSVLLFLQLICTMAAYPFAFVNMVNIIWVCMMWFYILWLTFGLYIWPFISEVGRFWFC